MTLTLRGQGQTINPLAELMPINRIFTNIFKTNLRQNLETIANHHKMEVIKRHPAVLVWV